MNKPAKQPGRDDSPISRRDAYTEFLKSKFWRDLRQRKLLLNPLCQIPDCGLCARDVHHVFYRPDWFDTQIGDLLSVCGIHHRKIHGIPEPPPVPRAIAHHREPPPLPTRGQGKTKTQVMDALYSRRHPPRLKLSKRQKRFLKRWNKTKRAKELRRESRGNAAYQVLMERGRL